MHTAAPQLNRESDCLTLHIAGDLLSTHTPQVRQVALGYLDAPAKYTGVRRFVLDLSGAKMIDSVGLNLIVALVRSSQQIGAPMQIVYKHANVHRILVFTRLDALVALQAAA